MRSRLIIITICFILTGCIEQIDPETLNETTTSRLVVEGLITNQKGYHFVKLSRTNTTIPDSTSISGVSGASVSISDGTKQFILHELNETPGTYMTDTIVQGEVGKTYVLTINYENERYTASATMEPVSPFGPIDEIFNAPNRLDFPIPDNFDVYELEFPRVRYGTQTAARQVFICIDPVSNTLMNAHHYEFPEIDPEGFLLNFSGANAKLFLEEGTSIYQAKYSLSKEHYEFIKAVYAQTTFRGAVFDRISANVPTNLTNGALGFFGASAVITRSFTVTKELLEQ